MDLKTGDDIAESFHVSTAWREYTQWDEFNFES